MIHIINRHCTFSHISANKKRPHWFSREKCFQNLVSTSAPYSKEIKLHVVFDGNISQHFLSGYTYPEWHTELIDAGNGTKSFKKSIDYALSIGQPDDTIYFLEDDYLHLNNWVPILKEGIELAHNGYVSLYDHNDKYTGAYQELRSQVICGNLSHWRTTPSTTDTFAIKKRTLELYKDQFYLFAPDNLPCTMDHERCLQLWRLKVPLITCIPGRATHCEPEYLSPLTNWETI